MNGLKNKQNNSNKNLLQSRITKQKIAHADFRNKLEQGPI